MKFLIWIICLFFRIITSERAGISHCSTTTPDKFGPNSLSAGNAGAATSYLMQDPSYHITCCGVLNSISFNGSGNIQLQIWRQNANTNFELVSKQDYNLLSTPFTPDDDKRVSFREGDLFGWTGNSINRIGSTGTLLSWTSASVSVTSVGDTHNWYDDDIDVDQEYQIQIEARESTPPYFTNLPATLSYADTELLVSGVTLMTLSYKDIDPDDAADLTVSISPAWSDMFELTTDTDLIKTKESLEPGTYLPVFRIEEGHCGKTSSATLTVSVTDSAPTIDNLPGFAMVHEDDLDETLLYTVTMSDPANQAMWCKENDWTIGTGTGKKPFIVKMISTAPGSSQAGIYMIEDPKLDYDTNSTYDLTIECMDTFGTTVTGSFWVNVIRNQEPIFANLPNMVEIDAATMVPGTVLLTVSTTDRDGDTDQRTLTPTSCTSPCPFTLLNSGEVLANDDMYLLTPPQGPFTMAIEALDTRTPAITAKNLIIYVKSKQLGTRPDEELLCVWSGSTMFTKDIMVIYHAKTITRLPMLILKGNYHDWSLVTDVNNPPVFTNVNGQSVSVDENEALGKSLYQMSATDADTGDTLTYFMTSNDPEGYDVFQLSSTGELTTHSTFSINYDILTTTSFTLTIYVSDGKTQVSETFTASVNNVNEAPVFIYADWLVSQNEGPAASFTSDPGLMSAIDPDSSDTLRYTTDCGTFYDTYISIFPSSGRLRYILEYDLDNTNLGLGTAVHCDLYVHDAAGLNDTARLYIDIKYINEHTPVFNPASYAVDVSSDTPMGFSIIQVTATDADLGEDTYLKYTLDQSSVGSGDHFIIKDGIIYATDVLTSLANEGTKTVTVTVADDDDNQATATVVMTFLDSTVVKPPTTDRSWEFIEDQRNITWLTTSVITIATCLLLVVCCIIQQCMRRKTPLIDWSKVRQAFKSQPKRQLDRRRRPMPFGRQEAPQYRHVHANEVLVPSPVLLTTPAPVDRDSMKPGSATSGRVTVTEVRVNDSKWMDGTVSPEQSIAPVKSITRPRIDDWDYMNPNRSTGTGRLSADVMYGPEKSTLSQTSGFSKQRRSTSQRLTPAQQIPVSPSPVEFENIDDDFRSERLSIASPSSQITEEPFY